jgi:hypothetical protein
MARGSSPGVETPVCTGTKPASAGWAVAVGASVLVARWVVFRSWTALEPGCQARGDRLHQDLGLGARDEDGRGDTEGEPEEFARAGDIGQRLAAQPALQRFFEARRFVGRQRAFGVGEKREAVRAQSVGEEQLGVQPRSVYAGGFEGGNRGLEIGADGRAHPALFVNWRAITECALPRHGCVVPLRVEAVRPYSALVVERAGHIDVLKHRACQVGAPEVSAHQVGMAEVGATQV